MIVLAPAGETQELRLKDGTRAIGRVETIEGAGFTFRTSSGVTKAVETAQVSALGSVARQVSPPLRRPDTMSLAGPRVGMTFLSDGYSGMTPTSRSAR